MRKRKMWRVLLASAVIGLVDAAGLDRGRRAARRPLRIVWIDDREPADPLARAGVWFLHPIGDPRPAPGDQRRSVRGVLSLLPFRPRRAPASPRWN